MMFCIVPPGVIEDKMKISSSQIDRIEKPLRVVMLIHSFHPLVGGMELQLGAIAPLLGKQGIEVHILTRRHKGLKKFEIIKGVPVHRLPIPGPKPVAALIFIVSALFLIKKIHPDVINAHELYSTATTAIMAKLLMGIPIVVTPHRSGLPGDVQRLKSKIFGSLRMALFRKNVDIFTVISNEIKSELKIVGVPEEHCVSIPNGVNTAHFKPLTLSQKEAVRSRLGFTKSDLLVVFNGRLVSVKRVENLISIWPPIISHFPSATLLILGGGAEENRLRSMAGDRILFLGSVKDVLESLQMADLFVLPSSAEGQSNALLEALACALPAIVTKVGGSVDIIRHAENGWLIPPEDPSALKEAILTLLGDAALRSRLGKKARKEVRRRFSISLTVERLKVLYHSLGRQLS